MGGNYNYLIFDDIVINNIFVVFLLLREWIWVVI